ncbi:F0F1 ATP synthase subunit B family protein [Metamycoplasma neophronis]|uniref:ATP synthase subunit b n=1 Tax=Metamycoplasma neophronis TaxID=872983 RepID=A0ABY2Z519_9BACT|nr:ATP synthase F0 subunit B [Metamycoplasma neophronis]TPR54328.1 ATP synthase F0 subunit B [Metamycoplasma neophronis]
MIANLEAVVNASSTPDAGKVIEQELNKAFSGLTFNWPYFVVSLITLAFLTIIITFLVYKPIKKMIKNRQEFIQSNIDASIQAKEDALKVREENDKKIIDATTQAATIINNARAESERIVNSGQSMAKKKAEMMLEQAQILINKKQAEFQKTQKKIIMENAVELAKKIIGREIKNEDNIKMIDEAMKAKE